MLPSPKHVTHALQSVASAQEAAVDLASGAATVQHGATTNPAQLIEAVAEAGYQAHRVWDAGQ